MQPGQISVGQLYKGGLVNGLKVWTQPGGIGTIVFPQQPTNMPWFGEANNDNNGGLYRWPFAYSALYISGCGHSLNCWEVFEAYDPYEQEIMAYICCPLCSFVQQVMPLAQYQSYIDTPLVVA